MRHLNEVEKAIVRQIRQHLGWQDIAEYTTERVNPQYHLRDIRPAWNSLVADVVIVDSDGHGFYTTTWTDEDIERGYHNE